MKCTQCEHYSKQLWRCKLGKSNPPSLKKTKEVMMFMGSGYVCSLNDHKKTALAELGEQPGLI